MRAARLYLLFDPTACRGEPWQTLRAAIDGGVDVVQWRPGPTATADDYWRCREVCVAQRVPLIVNDDVMLAIRGHAAGAHVGQDDMPAVAARRLLETRWLGVSTHDERQVIAAAAAGADYIGLGPCHATATKGYREGLPDAVLAAAIERARALQLPLFAIGGITPDNLPRLRAFGVERIAVSSHVLQHDEPAAAAAALRRLL